MTEPSELPPNPSIGELNTEIDRARHDAARTMTALVQKFDKPVLHKSLSVARRQTPKVPGQVWLGAVALLFLLRWWHKHRTARR